MFLNLKILVFLKIIKYSDQDFNQCAECIAYAKHKVRYTQARIEYQKPIPE